MKQPDLVTERLLLRGFQLTDATEVQALAGNYNVSKPTLNIPYPYQPGMAEEWISGHEQGWRTRSNPVYAITLRTKNQLVGAISLMNADDSQAEMGYWIGEPYWGMGYCTEAATELIRWAFSELGLDRIVAEHLVTNPASGKVMQKVGMQPVETVLKPDRNNQQARVVVYEIRNG